jgi:hypothetical protein
MKNGLLKVGFACCLLTICLNIFAGFAEWLKLNIFIQAYVRIVFNELNYCFNILILIVLWWILVKFHKQYQLNFLLKTMILFSIATGLLSLLLISNFEINMILIFPILAFINVILYYIFVFRIMKIDKSEINEIEYLKNYSVAFAICICFLLIVNIYEFKTHKDLGLISHFLNIIPVVFLGIFFFKIKK